MKKPCLLLVALALPLLPAVRATVNPAVVSADAKWLVYADLNALRAGAIGQELIALGEKAQFDTGGGKIGVDGQKLLATIGAATAYGANLASDPNQIDGTLVVQGTADLRKIAESLLIQANLASPDDVTELTDLPFPAYALHEAKAKAPKRAAATGDAAEARGAKDPAPREVIIAFPPEPIVLVSKSRAQILNARDVFRGAAPSLAKTPASPLAKFVQASDGAYLFAASTVPAEKLFSDDGPQARIVKMTNAGSFALGERGENIFAHSELVASSGPMAEKLMKILEGMTAMMSLAETSDKQLADFLNSAAVSRKGDVVTLDLAYSSTRLAGMIKNFQQKTTAGPQNRPAPMINGQSVAEWQSEAGPAVAEGGPAPLAVRTIEHVALKNGTLLTLARQGNGGQTTRFDRIEISPAEGGAPLTFRPEFMRAAGPRGSWQQFQFPGADGKYTLKVFYVNDPDGKAAYAISARDLRPPATAADTKTK